MMFDIRGAIRDVVLVLGIVAGMTTEVGAGTAEEIRTAAGVEGGLIVHVGCGDGRLTGELGGARYLVHGLDADADHVRQARASLREGGLYGPVSVDLLEGGSLPYVDDLVNCVIVDKAEGVSMDEVMRVLAPGGVAMLRTAGGWDRLVKDVPKEIDAWTHFLHDASNNPVAVDTRVGPPRRMQWTCGPLWARSHEFTSSLIAMVSGGGRVFYVFDEGLTGVTTPATPERWVLIARDAFNGVLLWKKPLARWGAAQWKNKALRSIPPTAPRSLVADGKRVYVTLDYLGPVSALDAGTGQPVRTYEDTDGCQELRNHLGVLLVSKGARGVMGVDAGAGTTLWRFEGKVQAQTPAASGERVFFVADGKLHAVELRKGGPLWSVTAEGVGMVVPYGETVVTYGNGSLTARAADNGEPVWTVRTALGQNEFFIADNVLWQWDGDDFVGRDMADGEVKARLDTSDVLTPGHHRRCYQSKATVDYLITPWRGAEFIGIKGGANVQNDWLRGPCRYGIMPANGLLYAPPNPCFCYPGVKVTGFNALAAAGDDAPVERPRLTQGPAYSEAPALAREKTDGWPMYRHDGRRSGSTTVEAAAKVAIRWKASPGGPLTPPVIANGRVLTAAKDEHTLYAFDADSGAGLWSFVADGRIDSPPSIQGGLVLFGCADGSVYCLRAADGVLAWRLRVAPSNRRIVAFGRLESPWRVHGSVLLREGLAYFTAGRQSYLDGGVRIFAVECAGGRIRHETVVDSWARTRIDAEGKPFVAGYHMEGVQSDILVSQGDSIFLGQMKFDTRLVAQDVPYVMPDPNHKVVTMDLTGAPYTEPDEDPKADYEKHQRDWIERTQKSLLEQLHADFGFHNLGDRDMGLHVLATGGFLDDSWFNRTYWMYSEMWPGYYLAHRAAKTGQLLVVGPENTYVVQAFASRNLQSPLFTPGEKGYLLYADDNDNEPVLDDITRGTTKGWGFTRTVAPLWHAWTPIRIRAMVLTGKRLFVAGAPDVVDPDDPYAPYEGRAGGMLRVVSAETGQTAEQIDLASPPVFDGLAAAGGRLYLAAENGELLCLSGG